MTNRYTVPGSPNGLEVFYNAELTRWAHLSGTLQLVNSATQNTDTSVIPGVRLQLDF